MSSLFPKSLTGGRGGPRTVAEFGALGNGTTDDTAAIQAALAAADAIYFPPGTYRITAPLAVSSSTTINGAGMDTTTIHQTSNASSALTGVDITGLTVRDLTVQGPAARTGTGTGIDLTLSGDAGNATFYVELTNVFVRDFGVDGVAIQTPIVSRLSKVHAFRCGRHGINLYSSGDVDGTSTVLDACYAAGNYGAGIRLKQMAYTSLNACAGDANGISYELDTCVGIAASACGCEEPYDFSSHQAGYTGLAWKISNTKAVINAPYMIGNVGTAFWVTNGSQVTANNLYEGSPGNPDSPVNSPTNSVLVDSGCTAILNKPSVVTATNLAGGTTTTLPDAVAGAILPASQQATLTDDVVMSAASSNTLLSLSLEAGTWLVAGTVTLQQGAGAGNTDIRVLAGTATLSGGTSTTVRAASASQPAAAAITARVVVTVAGTVLLNAYPVAAATAKAATTANGIPGATSLQAIPLAA